MAEAPSSSATAPAVDAAAIASMAELALPEEMTLIVKWSGKDYALQVAGDDTLGELKQRICEVTDVLPKRQTLLYPKIILKDDSVLLSSLPLKPNLKFIMIGSTEDEIWVEEDDDIEVLDDDELWNEFNAIRDKDFYETKLERRTRECKIVLLNPCRKGKRLLVIDIDHTLSDHKSDAEDPEELLRPYLHEFLSAAYSVYDIMIWSATGMKCVKEQMEQYGILSNPDYKITALLDHLAMITVQSGKKTFDCKPLGVIWAKFPEYYNEKNTIMFDDLRKYFVMNPQNGLVIKPFREGHLSKHGDLELPKLTQCLLTIAALEDFSKLDHREWETFTANAGSFLSVGRQKLGGSPVSSVY